MKKYLILFLLPGLLALNSCSNDDDDTGEEDNTDPIVGTWILVAVNPEFVDVNACEESSTITFEEDNSGNATFFLESNDCEAENSDGTWENLGSGQYQVNVPFSGVPITSGTVEFNGANEFIFEASSFQFTFERQ